LTERLRDRVAEWLQNLVDRMDPAPAADRNADRQAMDTLRHWLWEDLSDADRLVAWVYTPAHIVVGNALQKAEREGFYGWVKRQEAHHG
jgi:hypothetical protein